MSKIIATSGNQVPVLKRSVMGEDAIADSGVAGSFAACSAEIVATGAGDFGFALTGSASRKKSRTVGHLKHGEFVIKLMLMIDTPTFIIT